MCEYYNEGNGVVIVTTKSAKEGKVQVSLNAQMSVSKLAKKLDLMNSYDFVDYQYDFASAGGNRSTEAKFFRANFGNPQVRVIILQPAFCMD